MLLIAGGLLDPNLQALAEAADRLGVAWLDWRVPKDSSPPCHWVLDDTAAMPPWSPDGHGLPGDTRPIGAFLRQDVFAGLDDPRPEVGRRAQGWYTVFDGWLLSRPEVRRFNADMSPVALNKPAALLQARQHGLRIPPTWVSNDVAQLRSRLPEPTIAKPVAGGGLCQTLADALHGVNVAYSAMPALIQPRLIAPELRVFIVGDQAHAFRVDSPSLDYRAEQDAEVQAVPVPQPQAQALRALMQALRMDFGAADFKTDPATGELVFLELNTSPMFARFNHASDGALTESMIRHLQG